MGNGVPKKELLFRSLVARAFGSTALEDTEPAIGQDAHLGQHWENDYLLRERIARRL